MTEGPKPRDVIHLASVMGEHASADSTIRCAPGCNAGATTYIGRPQIDSTAVSCRAHPIRAQASAIDEGAGMQVISATGM